MSYCSNCGGRLNDNGQCPNCGGVSEARITTEVKETPDVLACCKALLSETPLSGVEHAARTRSASVWVTFGAIYMISTTIAQISVFTSTPPNAFHGMLDRNMARVMERAENGMPPERMVPALAKLFTYSAAMSLVALLVVTLITTLIFLLAEERPTFTQALNITAFCTLPVSVCSLLALPVSILSVPFACGVLLLGFTASVVMYYFGLQKASEFKRSPFWLFILMVFVGELVLTLVSMLLTILIF